MTQNLSFLGFCCGKTILHIFTWILPSFSPNTTMFKFQHPLWTKYLHLPQRAPIKHRDTVVPRVGGVRREYPRHSSRPWCDPPTSSNNDHQDYSKVCTECLKANRDPYDLYWPSFSNCWEEDHPSRPFFSAKWGPVGGTNSAWGHEFQRFQAGAAILIACYKIYFSISTYSCGMWSGKIVFAEFYR